MTMHERRAALYEDCVTELAPAVSREEDCYLAPALEGLLIETLDPKLNVHKKRKRPSAVRPGAGLPHGHQRG